MSGEDAGKFVLKFLGAFRLTDPDNRRIHVPSKKGIALLALLATAERGERTRNWLQEKLWGSRQQQQAQSSLRRELSSLRSLLNGYGDELLDTDPRTVRLNLERTSTDIADPFLPGSGAEFLEGIDLAGEAAFDEWLGEMRANLNRRRARGPTARILAETRSSRVLALAVKPISLPRQMDESLVTARSEIAHGIVKCISARKWLPVLVCSDGHDLEEPEKREGEDPRCQTARYVLESEMLSNGEPVRLVLHLLSQPGRRLFWTETLRIGGATTGDHIDESIGRICNSLVREVFYAEVRRIHLLRAEELGVAELTHLVRQLLGQISVDSLGLAADYLTRANALGPPTTEQRILEAYVKVLSFMAGEVQNSDQSVLRKWTVEAISLDPTDWRGPLLASLVELWLGNTQVAIGHACAAKKLCPCNPAISSQLGTSYVWNGEAERGIAELDEALSLSLLDRGNYMILCKLALAWLMRGRLGQALYFCDQAASCVPELGLAPLLKIEVLLRLDRSSDAARVYTEMIRDKFDDLIAIIRRQRVLPERWLPNAELALRTAMEIAATDHAAPVIGTGWLPMDSGTADENSRGNGFTQNAGACD